MSVQIDQSITSKMIQTDVHAGAERRLPTLTNRFDFDSVYGIAVMIMIWGGFFVAFASL